MDCPQLPTYEDEGEKGIERGFERQIVGKIPARFPPGAPAPGAQPAQIPLSCSAIEGSAGGESRASPHSTSVTQGQGKRNRTCCDWWSYHQAGRKWCPIGLSLSLSLSLSLAQLVTNGNSLTRPWDDVTVFTSHIASDHPIDMRHRRGARGDSLSQTFFPDTFVAGVAAHSTQPGTFVAAACRRRSDSAIPAHRTFSPTVCRRGCRSLHPAQHFCSGGSTFPSQQVTYFLHPHVSLCVYLTLYLTFPHSLSFSVYLSPEAGTCGLRAGHATKHGGEKSSSVSSPFNCLYPSPSLPPSPPRGGLGDN